LELANSVTVAADTAQYKLARIPAHFICLSLQIVLIFFRTLLQGKNGTAGQKITLAWLKWHCRAKNNNAGQIMYYTVHLLYSITARQKY
jgi:hypothetical protein